MRAILITSICVHDGDELRAQVLRPDGQKVASGAVQYEDADAIHLGAFRDGSLEAVVSFTPYDENGIRTERVYQLRGAATRGETRGKGIGTQLISTGIEMCRRRNVSLIWCNGRSAARSFYERLGFQAVGEEFTTSAGPHFRFRLDLETTQVS